MSRRAGDPAGPDVLFDLSVLATETRKRGIGRYFLELAPELERASVRGGRVRVGFLARTSWAGVGRTTETASEALALLLSRDEPEGLLAWAFRQRIGTARLVRALGPRLLHLGYPTVTPLGDLGCPRVVTCHDLIPLRHPEHYANWTSGFAAGRRLLDRRRYTSARHVIAISRSTADDLMRLLGVPSRDITVVYNGVSLSRFDATPTLADATLRERYDLGERSLLVYAGDADWRKNARGMLKALALVRSRQPSREFTLVWAGALSATRRREVVDLAEQAGVSSAVRLLGYVPDSDLAALYRQAHCTLFVSIAEGFGYPVLEALACGGAVVTSNTTSLVEVAGDAARTVDPSDPEAIADAILDTTTGEAARTRRIETGRAWVSKFSLEGQGEETLAVYERMLRND